MFSLRKIGEDFIPPKRDPLGLLNDRLHDLILIALATHFERSPHELPSLYLAKSRPVSDEIKDGKSSMRFALHIKEQDHARDAVIVYLTLNADTKEPESC